MSSDAISVAPANLISIKRVTSSAKPATPHKADRSRNHKRTISQRKRNRIKKKKLKAKRQQKRSQRRKLKAKRQQKRSQRRKLKAKRQQKRSQRRKLKTKHRHKVSRKHAATIRLIKRRKTQLSKLHNLAKKIKRQQERAQRKKLQPKHRRKISKRYAATIRLIKRRTAQLSRLHNLAEKIKRQETAKIELKLRRKLNVLKKKQHKINQQIKKLELALGKSPSKQKPKETSKKTFQNKPASAKNQSKPQASPTQVQKMILPPPAATKRPQVAPTRISQMRPTPLQQARSRQMGFAEKILTAQDTSDREIKFREIKVNGDGDCGFTSLDTTRQAGVALLLENADNPAVRRAVAEDINASLHTIPETLQARWDVLYRNLLARQSIAVETNQSLIGDYYHSSDQINRYKILFLRALETPQGLPEGPLPHPMPSTSELRTRLERMNTDASVSLTDRQSSNPAGYLRAIEREEEKFARVLECLRTQEIYSDYIRLQYSATGRSQWLHVNTLQALAFLRGFNLQLWRKKNDAYDATELVRAPLSQYFESADKAVRNVLYASSHKRSTAPDHFSILLEHQTAPRR